MKGIINVLKPPGMTSHDVINFLRKLLIFRKIGHSGTLDPAAAGVLPVFVGKATKAIEFFMEDDKEYIAEMALGITTDTGDFEGNIVDVCSKEVDILKFEEILKEFVGEVVQIPPMYSAVRYKGKKLYELARQGITVKRKPRKVKIHSLSLLDYNVETAIVKVACSKGTYIRTLCEDIGNKLGVGACISCLVRTRSGPFVIGNSATLEEIQECVLSGKLEEVLTPIDECFQYMPIARLSREDRNFFVKGNYLFGDFNYLEDYTGEHVRVYNFGDFLGIAVVKKDKNQIALKVLKSLN